MEQGNIIVRSYKGGDEAALLACWNQSLPYDTIDERTFVNKVLCDANFHPSGLVMAEVPTSGVVGFVLAIARQVPMFGTDLEPATGYITVFATHPEWRRRGVARRLFAAAEAFLAARGRTTVFFASYAPNYFVPGVDFQNYPEGAAFLAAAGYARVYTCVSMDANIALFTIPDDVLAVRSQREAEGYRFAPLSPAYVTDTISLAHGYHPDWGRAVRAALSNGVPYDQFLIAIAPGNHVVGFCMFGGYGGSLDRFGPFLTDESQRGKGLGKVLLYLCLDTMRSKGLHGAWFLWTSEQGPAGMLYKRAGFTVTRRLSVMKKQLA